MEPVCSCSQTQAVERSWMKLKLNIFKILQVSRSFLLVYERRARRWFGSLLVILQWSREWAASNMLISNVLQWNHRQTRSCLCASFHFGSEMPRWTVWVSREREFHNLLQSQTGFADTSLLVAHRLPALASRVFCFLRIRLFFESERKKKKIKIFFVRKKYLLFAARSPFVVGLLLSTSSFHRQTRKNFPLSQWNVKLRISLDDVNLRWTNLF